jgi:predicted MFS family arabinose efflux permease
MSQSINAAPVISQGLTLTMALAAGVAVANIYYNQPMLGIMEHDLGNTNITGMIPTVTQLGYAAGLFLLVPLGDLMDKRKLIVNQFILLALTLILVALAPSASVVVAASLAMGICATVVQQVVPFAAALATPASRGKTMGTVMAGVLCGILLSRTLAGFVATTWGWRAMFWLAAPLAIAMALMMALFLPRNHPRVKMSYGAALTSLISLWQHERPLRFATMIQASLFASFSAFWTVLALHLQEPRYHLGANIAGLFGIIGAVGVIAAPIAGRIADRRGPALVISASAVMTLLSWLIFGFWGTIPGLIVGVIVLDFGIQSALVSNQHVVFALNPEARSRLNTVFMTGMFLGGAVGSASATVFWKLAGWTGVCGFGILFAVIALTLVTFSRARKNQPVHETMKT